MGYFDETSCSSNSEANTSELLEKTLKKYPSVLRA